MTPRRTVHHSPRRKGAHMSHDHYIQKFQCGHVHSQCRCASREKREIVVPKNCPDCSTVVPVSRDTPRPRCHCPPTGGRYCHQGEMCHNEKPCECCGDAPTAPREREMSALDQQVVEARKALEEWLYPRMGASEWESYNADVDALLTTHRRQVLQEVEAWHMVQARSYELGEVVHEGTLRGNNVPGYNAHSWAAKVVASLRDTKENV